LVTVYYANAEEANLPRAFGLDITVDNGATIDSLVDYDDTNFWVYPGNIVIDGNSVTEANEPIAKFQVAGREEEGLGTSGITIEMGSLYNDPCDPEHQSPPPLSGTLLQFRVSSDCSVAIAANAARGGVVLENPDVPADANFGGCTVVTAEPPCIPTDHPKYAEWVSVGEPEEWCYDNFCYGDADGQPEPFGRGTVAVGSVDLNVLLGYWQSNDVRADFNMDSEPFGRGTVRVGSEDLGILLQNWQTTPPGDCKTNYSLFE